MAASGIVIDSTSDLLSKRLLWLCVANGQPGDSNHKLCFKIQQYPDSIKTCIRHVNQH